MRAQERQHLKKNEFVTTVMNVRAWLVANRDRAVMGGVAIVAVIAIGGGYLWWRARSADEAGALFGTAMAIYESPIVPASSVPGATSAPGTYTSAKARYEAALAAFQQVAQRYPSTLTGRGALYQSAETLLALGRFAEAQKAYQQVADEATGTLYGSLAKMGVAEAELGAGQTDQAIKTYEALAADRDGPLPIDGVLMQLARAYLKAGKTQEARTTFKRVTDDFPESVYVTDARSQLALLG